MSKYIIDIPKTVGMGKVGSVHYTYFDGIQCQTIVLKGDEIEELNSDYINKHYDSLQDDAYHRGLSEGNDIGYKDGVMDGQNEAWEAARKIVEMADPPYWGVFNEYKNDLFGKISAAEAIAKLKAYEEQKADDKIEVGDEVIYNGTTKCIVVRPEDDERYASLIDSDGTHYSADHRECKKTGRHFDIATILEDMRND